MNKPKITDNFEIIGFGNNSVDTTTEEFKELQRVIIEASKKIPPARRKRNLLLSLRLQMETYLKKDNPKEILTLGYFLKQMVDVLGVKRKQLAEYIDYQESNLSAVLNDHRKINTDLALKFGEIFNVKPILFLHIQSKNELLQMQKQDRAAYRKYKLEDLLKMVG
ncbi:MAG: helix-turn-helix transcriptional regulator [Chitinophagales bacterium]